MIASHDCSREWLSSAAAAAAAPTPTAVHQQASGTQLAGRRLLDETAAASGTSPGVGAAPSGAPGGSSTAPAGSRAPFSHSTPPHHGAQAAVGSLPTAASRRATAGAVPPAGCSTPATPCSGGAAAGPSPSPAGPGAASPPDAGAAGSASPTDGSVRLWGLKPRPLGTSALRHHRLTGAADIRFYRYLEGAAVVQTSSCPQGLCMVDSHVCCLFGELFLYLPLRAESHGDMIALQSPARKARSGTCSASTCRCASAPSPPPVPDLRAKRYTQCSTHAAEFEGSLIHMLSTAEGRDQQQVCHALE